MELKKEVESLLFSSGKMMTEKELAELTNSSESEVNNVLNILKNEYDERDTSLMLVNSQDSWKLNVREKYMNLVTKIVADTELPFPVLETLAVVAYKAPVVQAEVVKIRGTNAYEQIGILVDAGFVEKRKEGRSFRVNLTPKFFEYFDVAGDGDIKDALKDVKVPEKKEPEHVGKLDVVDVPPEEKKDAKDKLGDLEVIDEPEIKEDEEQEEKASIEDNKPDEDFLKNIEAKIDDLSKRNDNHDNDELFKRQEELNREREEETSAETKAASSEEEKEDKKLPEEDADESEDTEEETPEEEEPEEEAPAEEAPAEEEKKEE
ncbi:MAG: SMC-Scp complex subunit ScpB [Nanoarchaeota archaeon]|nr:SMC-Scp complex subunit ScpB [Nanoarchaeota archaeon]MBU1322078.1 SMC-Scp complex subunit ScpB [Nanoarchaeota archaeon]MBU1598184.1 SMC-Scp complex subunit ScpB [Nanoarchaeota archaeon]MBU2441314.1 SMC-Scp complex subunit ScpB [Nanoarchaeota archaeon]